MLVRGTLLLLWDLTDQLAFAFIFSKQQLVFVLLYSCSYSINKAGPLALGNTAIQSLFHVGIFIILGSLQMVAAGYLLTKLDKYIEATTGFFSVVYFQVCFA